MGSIISYSKYVKNLSSFRHFSLFWKIPLSLWESHLNFFFATLVILVLLLSSQLQNCSTHLLRLALITTTFSSMAFRSIFSSLFSLYKIMLYVYYIALVNLLISQAYYVTFTSFLLNSAPILTLPHLHIKFVIVLVLLYFLLPSLCFCKNYTFIAHPTYSIFLSLILFFSNGW